MLLEARPRPKDAMSPLESFALGALSKTMATVVTWVSICDKALDDFQRGFLWRPTVVLSG
jgi:hypothetical protein